MLYTANCPKCQIEDRKSQFEYDRSIKLADLPPPPCPSCQETKTEKIFTGNAGGFILKGPKWAKKAGY